MLAQATRVRRGSFMHIPPSHGRAHCVSHDTSQRTGLIVNEYGSEIEVYTSNIDTHFLLSISLLDVSYIQFINYHLVTLSRFFVGVNVTIT